MKHIYTFFFSVVLLFNSSDAQNLTELRIDQWENNSWSPGIKFIYFYNSSNTLDYEEQYNKDFNTNMLIQSGKTTYFYNSNGTVDYTLYQRLQSGIFTNSEIVEYSYNGSTIEKIALMWTNGGWVNANKVTEVYNNGLLTSITQEHWVGAAWQVSTDFNYTYNSNGQRLQYIIRNWDNATSSLVNWQAFNYNYLNSNNYLDNIVIQSWTNGQWINTSRSNYSYNSNNKVSGVANYGWVNNDWQQSGQAVYNYFADQTSYQLTNQSIVNGGGYQNLNRLTFLYGISVSAPEESQFITNVFPNPASNWLNIEIPLRSPTSLAIIDNQGNIVQRGTIVDQVATENISLLPPGSYTLILESESMKYSSKFIKID